MFTDTYVTEIGATFTCDNFYKYICFAAKNLLQNLTKKSE